MAPHSTSGFPELDALQLLLRRDSPWLRAEAVTQVDVQGESLPVWCLEMGSTDPNVPAVGFFGGVHGMERIGTQVLVAWLETLLARLEWDGHFADLMQQVRLVFMPMVNPGGLLLSTRANPAGIDLMRSAPVDAKGSVPLLVGGHRISRHLPWYRGNVEDGIPPEADALFRVVRERLHTHAFSMAMDCHSGFGFRDRIWFPYARSNEPAPHLPEAFALRALFNRTYPNHSFYLMEPQSVSYTTHGDLWDFLYDEHIAEKRGLFLPFTLEMGSWLWVKKNPRQFFSWFGHFNPILPHRLERVLRRHITLFDFLIEAAVAHAKWRPEGKLQEIYREEAMRRWYR
ncbi:MAG: M14 family zinc carboxypeptidase [Moraxellaceae bacterium]|nr:M14 family zinc carboxypeptidase [Moraxellaceae bacterium]